MGKRKKETKEIWEKELRYIQGVDPCNNACFRHDPSVFDRYVQMQAKFAAEDGFTKLAELMLTAIK